MKPKTKPKKPKHGRLYAILKRDENGNILGYTEHSFSMSWQKTECRVWRESELNYYSKKFSNEKYHELLEWLPDGDGVFLVRVNSKKCPIKVTMRKGCGKMTSSYWRNHDFVVKDDFYTTRTPANGSATEED